MCEEVYYDLYEVQEDSIGYGSPSDYSEDRDVDIYFTDIGIVCLKWINKMIE